LLGQHQTIRADVRWTHRAEKTGRRPFRGTFFFLDASFAWQDPAFMRDYEDRGRAVRVTAGALQTVDLEKN